MNGPKTISTNRRLFLQAGGGILSSIALATTGRQAVLGSPNNNRVPGLGGALGLVSASADAQFKGRSTGGKFSLLELPRIMRDELDMRVIDLNTSSFPDFATVDQKYLDKLRSAVADAGCILTNLKMNQRGLDMNSPVKAIREKAIAEYQRAIDIASQLGCRWARPLPGKEKPNMAIHVASYQRLCDYGASRNVQLLVENFGWMQADPEAVVRLVRKIGHNVAAGVDTGNWDSNEIREQGLMQSFSLAATCDFKARKLTGNGEHPQYNLRRCFEIGWNSGFRGPWCLEHANVDTAAFLRELRLLRDMLRKWISNRNDAAGH